MEDLTDLLILGDMNEIEYGKLTDAEKNSIMQENHNQIYEQARIEKFATKALAREWKAIGDLSKMEVNPLARIKKIFNSCKIIQTIKILAQVNFCGIIAPKKIIYGKGAVNV